MPHNTAQDLHSKAQAFPPNLNPRCQHVVRLDNVALRRCHWWGRSRLKRAIPQFVFGFDGNNYMESLNRIALNLDKLLPSIVTIRKTLHQRFPLIGLLTNVPRVQASPQGAGPLTPVGEHRCL